MTTETTNDASFEDDAAILAEMAQMESAEPEDEVVEPTDGDESAPEAEPDDAPTEEEETEDDEKEEPPKEPPPEEDDKLAKRLEASQKEEERRKAAVDAYRKEQEDALEQKRAELDARAREVEAKLASAPDIDRLKEMARYNLPELMRVLEVPRSFFEPNAKSLYNLREGAESDPRVQEAIRRDLAARRNGDDLSALREEIAALKAERESEREASQKRAEQERMQASVSRYIDGVLKSANDETPIVKNLLSRQPDRARAELTAVADRMAGEYGEAPDPVDVLKQFESEKRAELELYGADLTAIKANPKNQNDSAGETKAAKTISNELGTPTRPRQEPKSEEELDADILAEAEKLGL